MATTTDPVAQARLYRDAAAGAASAAQTSATLASNYASVAGASATAAQAALAGLTTTGTFSTAVLTPLLDAPSAGALTLGTTNATSISLRQNVTMPTGKTLVVGAKTLISSDQLNAANLLIASQAVGDILYASTTTAWARLAAVATGRVLVSAGTGTAPAWSATPSVTTLTGSTSLLTPLLDAVAAGALTLGTTTATSIALQQNVTMPTGKTLVVGANTLVSSDQLNAAKLLIAAQAAGDTLYASSTTAWARLAKGTDGQVLTLASGVPSWAAAGGGVTVDSGSSYTIYGIGRTFANNETLVLSQVAAGKFGLLDIFANAEWGYVYVDESGNVTTYGSGGSTNFATADTNNKLCVFKSGTQAVLKNRLGATNFLIGSFRY